MSLRIQIILVCAMLFAIVFIIHKLNKKSVSFRYGLGWLLVLACLLVLAAFPQGLDFFSKIVGIASPMNTLFLFGLCFSVLLIFSLSTTVSKQADRIKKLSQEIAIIRRDMYDNNNRLAEQIENISVSDSDIQGKTTYND